MNQEDTSLPISNQDSIGYGARYPGSIFTIVRLIRLVAGMVSTAGAEDVIEAILQDVSGFVDDTERYDDMTVVVVKKL